MNNWINVFVIVFIGLLLSGCSSGDQSSQKVNLKTISLTKEVTISADNPDVLIGNFSGLAVDEEGRITATDTRRQQIHLYSTNGQYLDSFGRKGKGPGEFLQLDPEIRIRSDTLYAKDSRNKRINLFSLKSRRPVGTINIPNAELDGAPLGSARNIFPLSDGNLLVSFVNPYRLVSDHDGELRLTTISLMNKSGEFIEKNLFQLPTPFPTGQTLGYFDDGIWIFSELSIFPILKMDIDSEEHLHVGKSDSLIIREYDQSGQSTNIIRENYKPASLSDSYMDSLYGNKGNVFKKAVNEAGRPDNWPVFADFFFDDLGRCWVELINPGKSQKTWWIFDRDGKARWQFKLPEVMTLHDVQNGKAYGISQPEGGISSIIRYDIAGIQN